MVNRPPRPSSHGAGTSWLPTLSVTSRSIRAIARSSSASWSPAVIRFRIAPARAAAWAIASAIVRPARPPPAPFTLPLVSSSDRLASATARLASTSSAEARLQSRARDLSGPNESAKPSGRSTSGTLAPSTSRLAAIGTTRDRPATPTCSPNRRAASRAWLSARAASAASRSSFGASSSTAATAARFFQTADSAGSSRSWRASFARSFFRVLAVRSNRRSRRLASRQASRSACTSGTDSSAESSSDVRRHSACSGSRASTPRTTSSALSAASIRGSMPAISASRCESSIQSPPAARAGAPAAAIRSSVSVRRASSAASGDTVGSAESSRRMASWRWPSTRATVERSRPAASS